MVHKVSRDRVVPPVDLKGHREMLDRKVQPACPPSAPKDLKEHMEQADRDHRDHRSPDHKERQAFKVRLGWASKDRRVHRYPDHKVRLEREAQLDHKGRQVLESKGHKVCRSLDHKDLLDHKAQAYRDHKAPRLLEPKDLPAFRVLQGFKEYKARRSLALKDHRAK